MTHTNQVWTHIQTLLHTYRCSEGTERRIHSNLLKLYADRVTTNDRRFPLSSEFTQIVFVVKVSSADIETYFSRTKYMKNLYRSKLQDDLASATLQVSSVDGVRMCVDGVFVCVHGVRVCVMVCVCPLMVRACALMVCACELMVCACV